MPLTKMSQSSFVSHFGHAMIETMERQRKETKRMTISARLLRKWRKEALSYEKDREGVNDVTPKIELYRKILAMTSELLDQHLLRK